MVEGEVRSQRDQHAGGVLLPDAWPDKLSRVGHLLSARLASARYRMLNPPPNTVIRSSPQP